MSEWTFAIPYTIDLCHAARLDADADLPSRYGSNRPVLIGGECNGDDFRIEVNGVAVCVAGDREAADELTTPLQGGEGNG